MSIALHFGEFSFHTHTFRNIYWMTTWTYDSTGCSDHYGPFLGCFDYYNWNESPGPGFVFKLLPSTTGLEKGNSFSAYTFEYHELHDVLGEKTDFTLGWNTWCLHEPCTVDPGPVVPPEPVIDPEPETKP
jgi:hypothetical protein